MSPGDTGGLHQLPLIARPGGVEHHTGGRTKRPLLCIASAVALAFAAVVVVRMHADSPIVVSVEPGVGVGIPNDVGQDTTYGEIGLVAPGGQDVTLVSARLVPIERVHGMQVVDVVAAEPSRGRLRVSSGQGFPTADLDGKTRSLRGAHVPRPGDKDWQLGVELVFQMRASRSCRWGFSGVEVVYDADGHEGAQFIAAPLAFCAPLQARCEPPTLPAG
jgi:hypothetical protein